MKKTAALLLVLAIAFSMAGCRLADEQKEALAEWMTTTALTGVSRLETHEKPRRCTLAKAVAGVAAATAAKVRSC